MKRERIEEIADIVDKHSKMKLEQHEAVLTNVSQMELRLELLQLEDYGRTHRLRGGAM